MSRSVAIARKIVAKDAFGSPRGFLMNAVANKTVQVSQDGIPLDGQRIPLGAYVGFAEKVKVTNQEDKVSGDLKTYYGLAGDFQAVPHDPERPATRAPVIYLPEHVHELVARELKDDGRGHENPNGSDRVAFAFEVAIKTSSSSTAGFVWEFIPKVETKAHDPLADLLALVAPAPAPAAIEAPVQAPEPAQAPAGKKKG